MIRKTKIIATIGPSTSSKEMLTRIIQKGVNVCRINFSHSSHDQAKKIIDNIKEVNKELHAHTAILADLQGPKIRIGEPIHLTASNCLSFKLFKFISSSCFLNNFYVLLHALFQFY